MDYRPPKTVDVKAIPANDDMQPGQIKQVTITVMVKKKAKAATELRGVLCPAVADALAGNATNNFVSVGLDSCVCKCPKCVEYNPGGVNWIIGEGGRK